MYSSQSPAARGWRSSCEDPALLVFLPGLQNCQVGMGERETIFFKMLVHIKCDFLEAPSMLLLHFKEGLFMPLVKSSHLRQRGFLQVWNSLERTFYTSPCVELTRSSHMRCCANSKDALLL